MKLKLPISILIILFLLIFPYSKAGAQGNEDAGIPEELVDTLNYEIESIYKPYNKFVEKIESSTNSEALLKEFNTNFKLWKSGFQQSKNIYSKYTAHADSTIARIAQLAVRGADLGIEACDKYLAAIDTQTENEFENFINEGDQLLTQAVDFHDQAVDLYNDYSGVSDSYSIRNWLIFFSILSVIFSSILFFKSRQRSLLEAEIVKAAVYKNLLTSSLWLTGGLIITTGGYYYAMEKGGTYYIFYGAIAVGVWQLLKGLYWYFTTGRTTLNELAIEEKHAAIKSSYLGVSPSPKQNASKRCVNCGESQPLNSIVCSNCGENIL